MDSTPAGPKAPDELVRMVSERRLIPFCGAGLSASLGLPDWRGLLKKIAEEVEGCPPFEELSEFCAGNPLQIAEYLFIKAGELIGPLRQQISEALRSDADISLSTAHIELVNLGAPQVYTTNFDDLIEKAYRSVGIVPDVVSLPRHLALPSGHDRRPQVVKYHGDLAHEQTLVITERNYYARLDFESPMDLKFRSDLLGRSVLFLGYSFSDINIRVIWFKLLQMMKDVPESERPISFIVRLERNPVLEALYANVGLRTIVLDPKGRANTPGERSRLLGEFLLDLAIRAAPDGRMPGLNRPMYMSAGLLTEVGRVARTSDSRRHASSPEFSSPALQRMVGQLPLREVPPSLEAHLDKVFGELAATLSPANPGHPIVAAATSHARRRGLGPGMVAVILRGLLSEATREKVLAEVDDWVPVYEVGVSLDEAEALIRRLRSELIYHNPPLDRDYDIAFAADLVRRLLRGEVQCALTDDLKRLGEAVLSQVSELYPTASEYDPAWGEAPSPDPIIENIDEVVTETELAEQEEPPDTE